MLIFEFRMYSIPQPTLIPKFVAVISTSLPGIYYSFITGGAVI
jgi:hypothetical protein